MEAAWIITHNTQAIIMAHKHDYSLNYNTFRKLYLVNSKHYYGIIEYIILNSNNCYYNKIRSIDRSK